MRVAVIGASGRTGALVVEQALTRGHEVAALARRPEALPWCEASPTRLACDVLDVGSIIRALESVDAVVSALGVGTSRAPTRLYSQGVANTLLAMQAHDIGVLAVISAAPVGPRSEQPFVERYLAMPVLERIFGATYDDMRRMEAVLDNSDVDWVSLRPPRLLDRAPHGRYRLSADGPLPKSRSVTYGDLATALLDCLERPDLYRRNVFVAN